MQKTRYFKGDTPPMGDLGIGTFYIEYVDDFPCRQVEKYGRRLFCSLEAYHAELGPGLTELLLSESEFTESDEITKEEFEEIWEEASKKYKIK